MKRIIKFSSKSCAPCKAYAPVFNKWVNKTNWLVVEMVDVEDNPEKASEFRVMSVPTTIAFIDDKIVGNKVWPLTEQELNNLFE